MLAFFIGHFKSISYLTVTLQLIVGTYRPPYLGHNATVLGCNVYNSDHEFESLCEVSNIGKYTILMDKLRWIRILQKCRFCTTL